ncbi:MAG: Trp family transcriptional regulator [Candidatus Roizmanbacteria bacterium]
MTRISRLQVDDEVLEKLYLLMFEVVGSMDEEEEFSEIINELLSPTEKIMVAKRVAIIYMLMKKIDYSTISNVLKVSSTTIAKFHSIMMEGKAIKNALKGIVGSEKIKDFFDKLFIDLRGPGTYGVNWKSAWKQKIDYEKHRARGI